MNAQFNIRQDGGLVVAQVFEYPVRSGSPFSCGGWLRTYGTLADACWHVEALGLIAPQDAQALLEKGPGDDNLIYSAHVRDWKSTLRDFTFMRRTPLH